MEPLDFRSKIGSGNDGTGESDSRCCPQTEEHSACMERGGNEFRFRRSRCCRLLERPKGAQPLRIWNERTPKRCPRNRSSPTPRRQTRNDVQNSDFRLFASSNLLDESEFDLNLRNP